VHRILNHAQKDTDGLRCPKQSFYTVICVVEVNTRGFEQKVTLSVMNKAEWCGQPSQVISASDVMVMSVSATSTDYAYRSIETPAVFHEPDSKRE
jgi:hypothetical protein